MVGQGAADDLLIARATALGRLVFSNDKDMLRLASERLVRAKPFTGIIFASQQDVGIGQCINDLELICLAGAAEEFENCVTFLPFV